MPIPNTKDYWAKYEIPVSDSDIPDIQYVPVVAWSDSGWALVIRSSDHPVLNRADELPGFAGLVFGRREWSGSDSPEAPFDYSK